MKLSELFPELVKIQIQGKEYEVKFGTRAVLQLERDYPDPAQMLKALQSTVTGMKAADLINFLFAGLLHTKAFPDKEILIDAIEPQDLSAYAEAIVAAYMQSKATPEQLEKLEVMAEVSEVKKKPGSETTPPNGPSTALNVD